MVLLIIASPRRLDDKSEFVLTILSSLAQDESRSLSESLLWAIKRRFEHGSSTLV